MTCLFLRSENGMSLILGRVVIHKYISILLVRQLQIIITEKSLELRVCSYKKCLTINSLWDIDTTLHHITRSKSFQVIAWCCTTPSHNLHQCWLIISAVQRLSTEGNFTTDTTTINHQNVPGSYLFNTSFKSPWSQWVKVSGIATSKESLYVKNKMTDLSRYIFYH